MMEVQKYSEASIQTQVFRNRRQKMEMLYFHRAMFN